MCCVMLADKTRVASEVSTGEFYINGEGLTLPATKPRLAQNPKANKSHVITSTYRCYF